MGCSVWRVILFGSCAARNNSIQGDPSVMERLAGLDPLSGTEYLREKVVISRNMGYGVYDRILR